MTARRALTGDRGIKVCDNPEHLCSGALVIADGPLAGQDVRTEQQRDEYQPRHLSSVYLHWWHGALVAPDLTDEELRDTKDTRFPITGGLFDGYPLGGRR